MQKKSNQDNKSRTTQKSSNQTFGTLSTKMNSNIENKNSVQGNASFLKSLIDLHKLTQMVLVKDNQIYNLKQKIKRFKNTGSSMLNVIKFTTLFLLSIQNFNLIMTSL
jgi:predicted DNA-binding ArsR family transcriptional regulator